MQAAEQLSLAVLQSGRLFSLLFVFVLAYTVPPDPQLVRGNQDLSSQLKIRKERLAWLVQFINENTVLIKVSISNPFTC